MSADEQKLCYVAMVMKPLDCLAVDAPWGVVEGTIKIPGVVGVMMVYETLEAAQAAAPDAQICALMVQTSQVEGDK